MPKTKKPKKRRPSDCRQTTKGGSRCPGKYKLQYEDNAPVFVCNGCGDRELTWKKFYDEYLQLYKQKENWDVDKNKVTCVIGFFCHMYKDLFGTDYVFVPQNPNPYGAKEVKEAWKLLATFKNDAHEVRKYIYWVFKKIIRKSTNLVSFNYINAAGIIRRYNLHVQQKKAITRSTKLPAGFLDWCKEHIPDIFDEYELATINDLGALLSYVKFYDVSDDAREIQAIRAAERFNLIKEGKLNIKE